MNVTTTPHTNRQGKGLQRVAAFDCALRAFVPARGTLPGPLLQRTDSMPLPPPPRRVEMPSWLRKSFSSSI